MDIKEFLKSKVFIKHSLIAISSFILLIIISLQILRWYTFHGESEALPSFTGWTPEKAAAFCDENQFKLIIVDSVYVKGFLPGVIVDQSPDSGFHVKKNRTIYLTINAQEAEKIAMPNLVDLSLRQAKSTLEHRGLILGSIDYKPDMAIGIVLKQNLNGEILSPGMLIPKGSIIDLTVGSGLSDEKAPVPSLQGLSLNMANDLVSSQYLRIGLVFYDDEITFTTPEDSMNARVYKQRPEYDGFNELALGSSIDIWLTTDSLKLAGDTIKRQNSDSTIDSDNQ